MFKDILTKEFNALKDDLIKRYKEKGMYASGNFERYLEVIVTDNKATLKGVNYTEQLEYGRRGGKFPPIEDIKTWILNKNVFTQAIAEIGLSSLAFLIARKISRQGWNRANYGGVDLISEVITPQRIQLIINQVGAEATTQFIREIDFKLWQ